MLIHVYVYVYVMLRNFFLRIQDFQTDFFFYYAKSATNPQLEVINQFDTKH